MAGPLRVPKSERQILNPRQIPPLIDGMAQLLSVAYQEPSRRQQIEVDF